MYMNVSTLVCKILAFGTIAGEIKIHFKKQIDDNEDGKETRIQTILYAKTWLCDFKVEIKIGRKRNRDSVVTALYARLEIWQAKKSFIDNRKKCAKKKNQRRLEAQSEGKC